MKWISITPENEKVQNLLKNLYRFQENTKSHSSFSGSSYPEIGRLKLQHIKLDIVPGLVYLEKPSFCMCEFFFFFSFFKLWL